MKKLLLCALLAELPETRERNAEKARLILSRIHRQNPQYVNILITDADGLVWAAAVSTGAPHLARTSPWASPTETIPPRH